MQPLVVFVLLRIVKRVHAKKLIFLKQLFDYTFNECTLQPNTFMTTVESNYCSNLSGAL